MTSPSEGFMFQIRPTRVSIVGRPANKRKFLVTKSQDNREMDEIIQIITETEAANEVELVEALKSAGKDNGSIDAVVSIYRTLNAYRESITEDDIAQLAKALKYETPAEEVEEVVEKVEEEAEVVEETEVEKTDSETAEAEVEVEEVVVEKNDELDELRSKVAELEGKTRKDELRKLVAGLRVGKTEDELVETLKAVENAGGEIEPILEVFKAADQSIRAVLGEIGSDLPGQVSADVYAQLEAKAREYQRVSDKPMSFAHAMKRAGEEHPELMKEYYE